jgi:hypothetical protein
MISFNNIYHYMFNIIICELLYDDDAKILGKNYMYSYYKPDIEWYSVSKNKCVNNYMGILIKSKKINFNFLKKWKLGINKLSCFNFNNKQVYDFSNLNIKKFYIACKINIVKFSNNVEEIVYNSHILDILLLKDLKYLKKYEIIDVEFLNYEKYYSNILFDKIILTKNMFKYHSPIEISVDVGSSAILMFHYHGYLDKIKFDNLYNVKYIMLRSCDLSNIYTQFLIKFSELEKLHIVYSIYDFISLRNILLNNLNLTKLNIDSKCFESREEIFYFCNN